MKKLMIALVLLLVGCAESEDHNHLTPVEPVITGPVAVVIGDSLSEGHPALHGLQHGQADNLRGQISYHLEAWSGLQVLNQGIGGQTCREIANRFEAHALKYEPEFIWLSCGQNDFSKGENPKPPITRILELASAKSIPVYIQTLGESNHTAKAQELNQWLLAQESAQIKVVRYDVWETTTNRSKFFADYIHPNKKGYESFIDFAIEGGL